MGYNWILWIDLIDAFPIFNLRRYTSTINKRDFYVLLLFIRIEKQREK
jgi:hypothetical protein